MYALIQVKEDENSLTSQENDLITDKVMFFSLRNSLLEVCSSFFNGRQEKNRITHFFSPSIHPSKL